MLPNQIIEELVSRIDSEVRVVSILSEDIPEGVFIFELSEFKWLRVGKILTSGNQSYLVKVKSVSNEGQKIIEVKLLEGTYSAPQVLVLPDPVFFHGTVRMINNEVSQIRQSRKKTPLVYLADYRNINTNEPTNRIKYEAPLRLFFLDEANYNDWTSDDYYPEVIEPMEALAKAFKKVAKKNEQIVDTTEGFGETPVIKFANTDRNGHISKLFTDDLSGYGLDFDLKVINSENCLNPFKFV